MSPLDWLSLAFGAFVGISLGLTGGGGSVFAVPLLIYGLGIPATTSMGLSLATVGLTAGFGAALRLRQREVEIRAGFVFAAAGMLVAPLGAMIGHAIPSAVLLTGFALLMILMGVRMWSGGRNADSRPGRCVTEGDGTFGPSCYLRLGLGGAAAGLLSGLFGVGGGMIIVPVLLHVTGMKIHRAMATSLLVIFLIAIAGVSTHLVQGQRFPMPLSALFLIGGLAGMIIGGALRTRLSGAALRKVFSITMWLVAVYMLLRTSGLI